MASKLNHNNIVKLIAFGKNFAVFELLKGGDFYNYLTISPKPLSESIARFYFK